MCVINNLLPDCTTNIIAKINSINGYLFNKKYCLLANALFNTSKEQKYKHKKLYVLYRQKPDVNKVIDWLLFLCIGTDYSFAKISDYEIRIGTVIYVFVPNDLKSAVYKNIIIFY